MVKPDVPMIVLTGGPGAGKTAVLEILKRMVCEHVAVLPEVAGMLFGGGFWRLQSPSGRRAAQRAIFLVQRELEQMVMAEGRYKAIICDRGTLDGMAYWPGEPEEFLKNLGLDRRQELERYSQVIHLRTPSEARWYNNRNPLRIETVEEAGEIDRKIDLAWSGHHNRHFVNNHRDFVNKSQSAILLLLNALPKCCDGANVHAG
ncbi:MAG: ATP-binding protein [Bdellovibrionia bacterium]